MDTVKFKSAISYCKYYFTFTVNGVNYGECMMNYHSLDQQVLDPICDRLVQLGIKLSVYLAQLGQAKHVQGMPEENIDESIQHWTRHSMPPLNLHEVHTVLVTNQCFSLDQSLAI